MKLVGRRYQLLGILGAGGMGVVYLALDRLTAETVAFKRVSLPTYDDSIDPGLAAMMAGPAPVLAREFQALAALRHPNIITVRDYGFDVFEDSPDPQPFFTMELLLAPRTLLDAGKAQLFEGRVHLLLQLLHALAYLHRRGFTHGDLKPANVLVTQEGMVKALDFGLAFKVGQAPESVAGTRAYMAPEMFKGQPASPAADLYAVGVMAYELFAGGHPFGRQCGQFSYDVMYTPANVAGLGLPPSLSQILTRLLAKTPAERPADVHEVIQAFSEAIGQPLPIETLATRESFLQAAELVGREAELAQLTQAFKLSRWGQGSAWLVGGESAVGKSRLLNELRTRALVQGALVLRGQAVSEGGLPYHLWREVMRWLALLTDPDDLEASVLKPYVTHLEGLLERKTPDAPELDPTAAQTRLFATLAALIRRAAAQHAIGLLLEDLHWADADSLALLNWLNRVAPEIRLLVVANYRDDERPHLPNELPDMTLLPLKRLSDESIADLSAAMLGPAGKQTALVDFLVRETEGNAFFIVEVVRALAEEAGQLDRVAQMKLPEHVVAGGMMSVVQRRLSRVRPADRPLLELAAVAGRQLDVALLQSAAHETDVAAWLMRCANAAVLEPQATGWRFAHDRLREGLLSEPSAERRRELHRRVALALEAAYPQAAEQAAALAHHWGAAGDPAKEARYAMLAGEQALKTSALREALQYFWRALAVFPEPPEQADETSRLRMTLLYRLGETYFQLGELREAHDNQQASLALAHALNDQKAKASALSLLGALLLAQGKTEQAEASLQDSLTLFRSLDAPADLARTLRRLGGLATSRGEYARARQFHEESLIIARKISEQKEIANNLNDLGIIARSLKAWEESARCYQDSLMLFKALGDRGSAARVLNNLSLVFSEQGRHAEALQFCQEALAVFEEIGDRMATTVIRDSLGSIAHALGDDAQARQHFKDSLAAAMEIGLTPSAILSLVGLAKIRVSAGDREQALELLGLAFNHPACDAEGRERSEPLLAELRTVLPPDVVEAALERGKTKDLNAVVAEILGEK